jgi:phosphoenolpyruvate---glycerone phosphotransferase subunit DhaL
MKEQVLQVTQANRTDTAANAGIYEADVKRRLILAIATGIIAHADELTALDAAIGDGDHGHNMKRGFEAVLNDVETLSAAQWPDLLKGVGTRLVMKVGGASGPLYGTFFMALGKDFPTAPSHAGMANALSAAVAAVKARGKSDVGQKTMIDVLAPAVHAFVEGRGLDVISKAAAHAAEATIPMQAIRGRASFLGERSIGHMDPGARSSSLIIGIVCDELGAI